MPDCMLLIVEHERNPEQDLEPEVLQGLALRESLTLSCALQTIWKRLENVWQYWKWSWQDWSLHSAAVKALLVSFKPSICT